MKRKSFLKLIILFLSLLLPTLVSAAEVITPAEAEKWAESKGEEILDILSDKNLQRKYKELDTILYNDVDLDNAAKFAMGKYWKTMTPEQKQRYVPLFKQYISSLYKSYPLDLGKGNINFAISRVVPTKSGVDVFCAISLNGSAKDKTAADKSQGLFSVLFALAKNNGRLQVRDIKIGESSLLLAFRSRFYQMIYNDSDGEIDWFLDDLQTITADNEEKNEQKLEDAAF